MARKNSGPAFNPPSPEPEDRIAVEGDIVCCLGECRQAVELATTFLSQQLGEYLSQIAVVLARIIEPVRAAVTAQLQQAQDSTDSVTVALEDAALHHLMQTAYMVQQLQAGLATAVVPLAAATGTQPGTSAAASVGVSGGALSTAQATGSAAAVVTSGAPAVATSGADQAVAGDRPLPLLPPGQLPPPPPGLYAAGTVGAPGIAATPEPPGGGAGAVLVPGGGPVTVECNPRPWPVDLPQLLPFLFSGDTDHWRGRALEWLGSEFAEKLAGGSFAAFAAPVDYFPEDGPGRYVSDVFTEVPDYAQEAGAEPTESGGDGSG